jgi:hypothetical protein
MLGMYMPSEIIHPRKPLPLSGRILAHFNWAEIYPDNRSTAWMLFVEVSIKVLLVLEARAVAEGAFEGSSMGFKVFARVKY